MFQRYKGKNRDKYNIIIFYIIILYEICCIMI